MTVQLLFHMKRNPMKKIASGILVMLGLGLPLAASAAIVVPGAANPNLAGRDASYTCCSGDTAASNAPVLVTGIPFVAGNRLTFAVTGTTSNSGGASTGQNPGAPDGNGLFSMTNYGDGISAPMSVRLNALMGVFLGAADPTGGTTPAQLDFSPGLEFASLNPLLGQIFFIGDGRTTLNQGPGAGTAQEFFVPVGATRLFLGTSDGFGWFNNSGDFTVGATNLDAAQTVIPLPAAGWLLLGGAGLLGGLARRRTAG
jgi:hypothetical protein